MESNQNASELWSWKAQTPENVGSQRVASSGEHTTSTASLSTDQTPSSGGGNYAVVITSSTDANVCTYCRKLAMDILTRPAILCPGWEALHSQYFTMKYLKEHQNGTVQAMRQSGSDGCQLCAFMAQQVGNNTESVVKYQIFVWTQPPGTSEFRLALGEPPLYLEDISQWKTLPISLSFFRKNGSDRNWHYLNETWMFSHGEWPPLLALPNQSPGPMKLWKEQNYGSLIVLITTQAAAVPPVSYQNVCSILDHHQYWIKLPSTRPNVKLLHTLH